MPLFLKKLKKRGVDYRLEVAGSGDEEDAIKKELNDCGADLNVRFLGQLNYADMAEFWKRQDVYLNFSEYEGASLAMLEAMSFGCVPVVTDVSGVSDYIENEIRKAMDIDNIEIIHYVAVNNELVEIESDTIKKSKSLSELQKEKIIN